MATELITSAANPVIKRMRLLADRKHRRNQGAAVVSGLQPVWQAVEAGAEIETLIAAAALIRNPAALAMVHAQEQQGIRVVWVSAGLFERLSDRDGPSGLAAIVRQRLTSIGDLAVRPDSVFVALDQVGNPGNLGTIIRTADATGAGGVILIGHTADPYDPAAIKASMGALFQVPVARVDDFAAFAAWAHRAGVTIVTTSAAAGNPLWETDFPPRLAVVMGSEGEGLDPATVAAGGLQVGIPMVGTAESLNLAVATGVLLYEIWRRRAN